MKRILSITVFLCSIFAMAQVSTTRLNDFKLGMKKSELEKIIGKKIPLKMNEYGGVDSPSQLVYKGIVYEVNFNSMYDENGNDLKDFSVYTVESNDKTLKTLSGIGIGNSLYDILEKYKDNNIEISDSWDDNGNRTKTQRYFIINDYDAGSFLRITLKNGKVTSFYVGYNEGC
ncbi:hypothetical protein [Faecalibacter rhinopitheci]|uniref:Uncharacterized protein n=1 Tax=Faecalibacter rhinopitheci TaxID=2779678 RepID=A0A8J7FNR9_9FLAO|nr:hypothetical protein [Faecalibacter rhinopitheci]MBF0596489.1 hypothetical protein [Faecalibacter rhinopitheci]MBQ0147621.1 hypothetical protein [Candidatus Onthonaster equi]